jgi:alpha-mannosidase
MYRVMIEEPSMCCNNGMELEDDNPYLLENEWIRAAFDKKTGLLTELTEKRTGCNALKKPVEYQIWTDERDTWGEKQEGPYEYTGEDMRLRCIEKVESGRIRECIRAVYEHGASFIEQLYYLYEGEKKIVVENRLYWDKNWHSLKLGFPLGIAAPLARAEGSYETITRTISDEDEYYMHRFLDITAEGGEGLAIANDSKYCFSMKDKTLLLTLARSAMYAQGHGKNWHNPLETYEYTDIGKLKFTFVIRPHKEELAIPELYRMADKINSACEYLADSCHTGVERAVVFSLAATDKAGVEIMAIKKAEDDGDYIVRVLETEGRDQSYTLVLLGSSYPLAIGHNEIQTLKIDPVYKTIKNVNFLEYE